MLMRFDAFVIAVRTIAYPGRLIIIVLTVAQLVLLTFHRNLLEKCNAAAQAELACVVA